MKRRILTLAVAVSAMAFAFGMSGHAVAAPQGNAFGHGCESGGATAKNPGQWFKALKEHDLLNGLNPKQIADLENSSEGWAGEGITPNVGALIANFCGPAGDDED